MDKDKLLDFIEDHRIAIIGVIVLVVIVSIVVGVSNAKLKKEAREAQEAEELAAYQEQQAEIAKQREEAEANKKVEQPYESYEASLGLNNGDGRINVQPEEEEETSFEGGEVVQLTARYPVDIVKFDWVEVPEKMVDGSSCKDYLASVSKDSFHLGWGTELTEDDFTGGERFLVGTEQNPDDTLYGDLQSVGWLMEHLDMLEPNDAVKFCNLHVIGDLGTSHIALLCSYDWYSAFGLKDTLVVFEDTTGTFDKSLLSDGDIFSTTVFAHNIEKTQVNGQNVIIVQWADYANAEGDEHAGIIDTDSYKSAVDKLLEERQTQSIKEDSTKDESADDVLGKTQKGKESTSDEIKEDAGEDIDEDVETTEENSN